MELTTVDLRQIGVNLCKEERSGFVAADFSTGKRDADGVISWTPPGHGGLYGGIAVQETAGDHGGERHLDGEELLVVLDGVLRVVLLDGQGTTTKEVRLTQNQAVLVPRTVWHRVAPEGACRYLFMGGGRTEIKTGG